MRKTTFLFVVAAFTLISCTKEVKSVDTKGEQLTFTASAAGPETKTVLQQDGVSLWWAPGDEINLFYGSSASSKFTSQNKEAAQVATFKGAINVATGSIEIGHEGKEFWGVYPYSSSRVCDDSSVTVSVPSAQQPAAGTFPVTLFPSVAKSTSLNLAFYNVCGGLKFSVSYNDVKSITFKATGGQTIAGDVKVGFGEDGKPVVSQVVNGVSEITITPSEGQFFQTGKDYYVVMLPAVLSEGFRAVVSRENTIGVKDKSAQVTVSRSSFGVLSQIDKDLAFGQYYIDEYGINQGLGVMIDGVIWAPVNCGYKAPSIEGKGFPYGKQYQWGRRTGCGWQETDESYPTFQGMWTGKNGEETENVFYRSGTDSKYEYDWIKDGDESFWNSGTDENPQKTQYDPCPEGWRVPTKVEIDAICNGHWEYTSVGGISGRWFCGSNTYSEELKSKIFLPLAGAYCNSGDLDPAYPYISRGSKAFYWSSYKHYQLYFHDGWYKKTQYSCPSDGSSVRCVSEDSHYEPGATDLSVNGTANCYIVSAAGTYKFNASVKGNSTESVGTPVSAEVLWESFGTDVAPSVGDIIASASLTGGYVTFSTPETLANGNAVIAVKDANGTILWSWHIWVCDGFDPISTQQVYANNAGTMMDRDLGATSAEPGSVNALGLFYEWGRKDPFLGNSSITDNTPAQASITWPKPVTSSTSCGTIEYATQNPMVYINGGGHWNTDVDMTLWNNTKTKYDPCPYGWKVPEGGQDGLWAKAFKNYNSAAAFNAPEFWSETNHGMLITSSITGNEAWYPAGGYIDSRSYNRYYNGNYCYRWSITPKDSNVYVFSILCSWYYTTAVIRTYQETMDPSSGHPVRCCKE